MARALVAAYSRPQASLRVVAWLVALASVLIGFAVLGSERPAPPEPPAAVWTNPVVQMLPMPVGIADPNDGTGRQFIVLHEGQIRVFDGSRLLPEPFLDVSGLISCCREQGLLGLVFHPDFENNGEFFVNYTDHAGTTVVARYRVSGNPNVADPGSASVVLTVERTGNSHNGGIMQFGPDGYMYIGVGDGTLTGAAGADNPAQDLARPGGKVLRIDVDAPAPNIPPDNPFVGDPGADGRVFAYGLRNPWRLSFDRETRDMIIGEVGASAWEEIDFIPAGSPGGLNFGWSEVEGRECRRSSPICTDGSVTPPVIARAHREGFCAIIGGYRYRGSRIPGLAGSYLYSDYCHRDILTAGPEWKTEKLLDTEFAVTSFGEDEKGELYVTDLGEPLGAAYRFEPPVAGIVTSPAEGAGPVQLQSPLGDTTSSLAPSEDPGPRIASGISGSGTFTVFGSPAGSAPRVRILNGSGDELEDWPAFGERQTGGLFVGTADTDGDGTSEVVASLGGEVRVFSIEGRQLAKFTPYSGFEGDIYPAGGDLDGDGRQEIVTSPGLGTVAEVKVFGLDGDKAGERGKFLAYQETFKGGARIAVADLDPDGKDDIFTIPGRGGGPFVNVFSWGADAQAVERRTWLADAASNTQGSWIAAGNLGEGPGGASVVIGNAGGSNLVRVFSATGRKLAEFTPYPRSAGGVMVAVAAKAGE